MSPSRSNAISLPSRETSTFIQVPLSTLMRIWRVVMPGGALTSHFAGFGGAAAGGGGGGVGRGGGLGGGGRRRLERAGDLLFGIGRLVLRRLGLGDGRRLVGGRR